ncbi:MAG: methyltransferase domain-containing protein [Ferruginibacter sp.]|nr:methyltransferase domain-containing protein [Ferruginibacter sp.]
MKQFLLDLLVDIDTKENLKLNKELNKLVCTRVSNSYDIIDSVPIILPKNIDSKKLESPIHKKYNTKFNYTEHYKIDAEFNDYFEEESIITKKERERNRQSIISKVQAKSKLILDVGCGSAWVAKHFTKKGKKVISMDVAIKNPIEALKKIDNENHAALVADVFNLPIKTNTIDAIIASEVIEHLHDPSLFIANLLTTICEGGKIILLTPYNEKLIYHTCVHCNTPTPSNAHLHSFNEKNIENYLPKFGIKYTTSASNNKYFIKLRLYSLLHFLPFNIWFYLDKIANKIIFKPTTFIIEITKLTK